MAEKPKSPAEQLRANIEHVHGKGYKPARPLRPGKGRLWKPPPDMPEDMIEKVRAGKMCGCKTIGGLYCRARPVGGQKALGRLPPYRCAKHGGMHPGILTRGNRNNLKHGLYTDAVLPGEEEIDVELGNFHEEIRITKLRLRRALIGEAREQEQRANGQDLEAHLVTIEKSRTEGYGPEGPIETTSVKQKAVDWQAHINAIVNQLVKLTNQQNILDGGGGEMTAEQRAAVARQFLKEARESTYGGETE